MDRQHRIRTIAKGSRVPRAFVNRTGASNILDYRGCRRRWVGRNELRRSPDALTRYRFAGWLSTETCDRAKLQVRYQPGPQSWCSTGIARWSLCGRRECGSPGRFPGTPRGVVSRGEYGVRMDDEPILALVKRLARPHASGGAVIERAAILADGADFASVMAWIADPPRATRGKRDCGFNARTTRIAA